LRRWQALLQVCPHGSSAPQLCKQPPSGTLLKSAAVDTLVNTDGCAWHLSVKCVPKASCLFRVSFIFGQIVLLLVKLSILPASNIKTDEKTLSVQYILQT
jgi:hypothetical protein